MRQYLSSVAKKDAKVLVENTYYDISSIMRDTVTDLLPTHELEVDERLVHLYLKSVRIIKFASEALKAEIRAKKIMRCLRRRKLTIERGINIVPPETPLYVETHETVETLRHLLPLKVNMNEIEMEETLIRLKIRLYTVQYLFFLFIKLTF